MYLVQVHSLSFTAPTPYCGEPAASTIYPFLNISQNQSSMPEFLLQSKKFAPLKTIIERMAGGYEKEIKKRL